MKIKFILFNLLKYIKYKLIKKKKYKMENNNIVNKIII
jgi:hypothetical protein